MLPEDWPARTVDADGADLERAGHGVVEALGEDGHRIGRDERDRVAGLGPDDLVVGHPLPEVPVHDEEAGRHEEDHEEQDDEEFIAQEVRKDLFSGDRPGHGLPLLSIT